MSAEVQHRLLQAQDDSALVRVERRKTLYRVDGFVVAVGAKWTLLRGIRDGGFFDGYVALRNRDVKKVRPDTSFEGAFARTQAEWPPAPLESIDLGSTKRIALTLGEALPLIGIEQEFLHPECQWIGVPVGTKSGWLGLHEVKPNAKWRKHPAGYRLKHITTMVVGNGYLTALAQMAGNPPE